MKVGQEERFTRS